MRQPRVYWVKSGITTLPFSLNGLPHSNIGERGVSLPLSL